MVPGGGSVQLGKLIDEHGEALLYDLQGIGLDLRDLWRDGSTLTPRLVLWLAGQLPPDSAFAASMQGGTEFRWWTPSNQLLVGTVNQLYAANQQRAGKRTIKPLIDSPKRRQKPRVVRVAELVEKQRHT